MSQVIIYGTTNCPRCNALKHELDKRSIEYTSVDVRTDADAATMLSKRGFDLLPVISKDDKFFAEPLLEKQLKFIMED